MKRLQWYRLNDGLRRADLPNGEFVDYANVQAHMTYGYKYSRWIPGASPSGCAVCAAFGNRLADVLPVKGGA